ncbi:MAG: SH3 domain-containing protein, partial [Anaerolineales bacterium]|nr:SH3 domain-containing protein [Anaerolineales bacterium]
MNRNWFKLSDVILRVAVFGLMAFFSAGQVRAADDAQQSGVFATVIYTEPINVRGGPSTVYYPIVGRVSPGDVFPAIGVSPGREWVQIAYPQAPGGVGWLYAIYVRVEGGELQIVEPPPTATPIATTTINPTFAAAFVFQPTATRMPTFTPPPPLE